MRRKADPDALQAKPNSGQIIDSLGWVYYKKGQIDKAVVELERAHRSCPRTALWPSTWRTPTTARNATRSPAPLPSSPGTGKSQHQELRKKINDLEVLLKERSL